MQKSKVFIDGIVQLEEIYSDRLVQVPDLSNC